MTSTRKAALRAGPVFLLLAFVASLGFVACATNGGMTYTPAGPFQHSASVDGLLPTAPDLAHYTSADWNGFLARGARPIQQSGRKIWQAAEASIALIPLSNGNKEPAAQIHTPDPTPAQLAGRHEPAGDRDQDSTEEYIQRGIASWYGGKWDGRKTANGEIYDTDSMTAAHKRLPFGSLVQVRNLENGREVTVRINNRGPFVKGRIIDLSPAAAKKLGFYEQGITNVEIERIQ